MAVIHIPRRHFTQPQGRVEIAPVFTPGIHFLFAAGAGRLNVAGNNSGALPSGRVITPTPHGLGFDYSSSGDDPGLSSIGPTNHLTFFSVFIVRTPVAWAGAIYNRGGVNGQAFGNSGLEYKYVWGGPEWNYDTGLTFGTNSLVACAHTVLPSRVIVAVNGAVHVRTGLSNPQLSGLGPGAWIGQDPQGGRVLNGFILAVGVVEGAGRVWDEEQLREWSSNPWQMFRADPIRIYSLPAATTPSSLNVAASNITSSGARATVTLVF